MSDQLLLLDVGSCFNPFSVYSDIQAVPIDLQPADSVSLSHMSQDQFSFLIFTHFLLC